MGYSTIVGAIALLIQCTSVMSASCNYPTQYQSNYGYYSDYYVGEMRLGDGKKKGKRNVIWPWKVSHSMILFRGKVFEWGIMKSSGLRSYDMTRDPSSCKITWRSNRGSYSSCTLSQVENWTRNYGATNTYNLLTNNCHMFVNKLAKYLYDDCATK